MVYSLYTSSILYLINIHTNVCIRVNVILFALSFDSFEFSVWISHIFLNKAQELMGFSYIRYCKN